GDKSWYEERLPLVEDRVRDRLDQLSGRLGEADWLDGAFSAGDLMMVSVLLRLKSSGFWTNIRIWPPMSPAAKRGPPTSGLSTLNWRFTPASYRPADLDTNRRGRGRSGAGGGVLFPGPPVRRHGGVFYSISPFARNRIERNAFSRIVVPPYL